MISILLSLLLLLPKALWPHLNVSVGAAGRFKMCPHLSMKLMNISHKLCRSAAGTVNKNLKNLFLTSDT